MSDSLFKTNPFMAAGPAKLLSELRKGPRVSLVVYHLDNTRVVQLSPGHRLVVGRDSAAEISIGDASVSRRHAQFELSNGVVSVSDLGSTNGTRLNGVVLKKPAIMGPNDEVSLGNVTISIHARAPLNVAQSGLSTHDQFMLDLESEVERARTFRRNLAVVMAKDEADPQLGASLMAKLRRVDRLAAYGDGTIEIVMPETNALEARALLEPLSSTLVYGIAVFPDQATSAEALLEASRDAMRRGKMGELSAPLETAAPANELIFVNASMRELFETVLRVANSVIPVLIQGETGTGKEVLAHAIHHRSARTKSRLVAINCGAIPPTLVESVLFGHERGAFTGAVAGSPGVFEEADGGTVLLDEVGELSPTAQAALLRVLETKQVRRVGASREVTVDVRVIAATHRDLEGMVKTGAFREDLLYRLNTTTLEVPPLRDRPEEIGPFVERFIATANSANTRKIKGIDKEATRLLLHYPWPGNIRELRNAIEHAVVVTQSEHIQAADLPKRVRDFVAIVLQADTTSPGLAPPLATSGGDLRDGVARYETQVILEALRATRGNRTEAARRLQIPVRTLSHKLRQYGIKKLGFGTDEASKKDT